MAGRVKAGRPICGQGCSGCGCKATEEGNGAKRSQQRCGRGVREWQWKVRLLAGTVAEYLEEIKLSKKPKTHAAYSTALVYFVESC